MMRSRSSASQSTKITIGGITHLPLSNHRRRFILTAAIGAMTLAGCQGGDDAATAAVAEAFADHAVVATRCIDDEDYRRFDGLTCDDAFGNQFALCVWARADGSFPLKFRLDEEEDASFDGASREPFRGLCDRWDVVLAMPVFLARSELIQLSQEAHAVADGRE
jgi:hypothetical protein